MTRDHLRSILPRMVLLVSMIGGVGASKYQWNNHDSKDFLLLHFQRCDCDKKTLQTQTNVLLLPRVKSNPSEIQMINIIVLDLTKINNVHLSL